MQTLIKKKTYQICIFPSLNFPYFQMERKNSMLRPISIVWMTEFLNYDNAQSYIISFWWIYIYMYTVYKTLTRKIKMQNTYGYYDNIQVRGRHDSLPLNKTTHYLKRWMTTSTRTRTLQWHGKCMLVWL